jgi:acylglycerol lipase
MCGLTPTAPLPSIPRPRITSGKIFTIGGLLFVLALVWPPLLLIITAFLSITIPYAFRENDDGESRRLLWNEFAKRDDLPHAHELKCEDVALEENYWVNDRGMALMTSTMAPKNNGPIRGVICFCHGYMDNPSFLKRIHYQRFVKKGFAVVMIEYEGHGRSDGPNALIPCWHTMVGDVQKYFSFITERKFPGKRKFLMGESMGGAIAYDLISHHRSDYEGVILVAPMLKISVTPPDWVVNLFYKIVGNPGTVTPLSVMPLSPTSDIPHLSFKDKEKMRIAFMSPSKYGRKPRLATSRELLDATKRISASIDQFDAPFLVVHGLEDYVTCPEISETFYNESPSKDKEMKLYKGMYHNLTAGETDENIEIVFNDAISWAAKRSSWKEEGPQTPVRQSPRLLRKQQLA